MIEVCKASGFRSQCLALASLLACVSEAAVAAGFPLGTDTQPLFMVHSQQAGPASGDFVSSDNGGGLNTYYSYFVEVPPGLTSLQVEIFDPDINQGPAADEQPLWPERDSRSDTRRRHANAVQFAESERCNYDRSVDSKCHHSRGQPCDLVDSCHHRQSGSRSLGTQG
jgi:hypothetical protein